MRNAFSVFIQVRDLDAEALLMLRRQLLSQVIRDHVPRRCFWDHSRKEAIYLDIDPSVVYARISVSTGLVCDSSLAYLDHVIEIELVVGGAAL